MFYSRCQQCDSHCSDLMRYVCTKCKRIFCQECMRGHTKQFPDHEYVFRDNISRGLEYRGEISIDYGKFVLFELGGARVIDMKCVKGMVVIIMFLYNFCFLQVYSAVTGKQCGQQNQLKLDLDKEKSQIAIIDENTVAVTAPCRSRIHIVNVMTNIITTIDCMTDMTGAIAFIDSRLYVACNETIWTMTLQGENRVSIGLPDIQFLHPVGQNKMYCISRNPQKNISYLDMTNMKEHQLPQFPFHPVSLTTDDFGNIYFISHNVVLKAAHNGTDYKVILSQDCFSWTPKQLCFDISNNLLLVQIYYNLVSIYRTG